MKVKEPCSLLEPQLQEPKRKKKKKRTKTPILTIPTTPCSTALSSQEMTVDLIDDTDEVVILDSSGSLPNVATPSKNPIAAEDFIPLEASTPVIKRKKETKLYINPLAHHRPMTTNKRRDPLASKEKRISSLKKLLAEESPKFPRSGNTLKSFLSRL